MQIRQFEDKNLAHYSYAILSDCEKKIILIDPARNPQQYIDYAKENDARITGVIETHPHADFVSSHLELHKTLGATIYASKIVNATYPHQTFDDGEHIQVGNIKLSAINTPGHSPDSICILLEHDGTQKAVFTGDTLFIGDCGRPDLREENGNLETERNELAKQMYHSLRDKLMPLNDDIIVYPAHGAGTLCGKALSNANSSTIGEEKKTNWSLKQQTEGEFVKELLSDQPFVPAYFSYDVELNKKGAIAFNESTNAVNISQPVINQSNAKRLNKTFWIVDVRDGEEYKKGHLPHSINLMRAAKFETWLGSIIKPGEPFYITASDNKSLKEMIERTAAIGYEAQIEDAFVLKYYEVTQEKIEINKFEKHTIDYTIVDVRNASEVKEKKIFENSISIPLGELREDVSKIPVDKPIVVHCASGYRSAAASSFLQSQLNSQVKVFDLGEAVKKFM
ncbi:MAG: MBL fold metallo-hydrolase [Bacteroidota bacterium]|nr:MBL fold metallo-hydrolase [Bacteroidota bacterium]